MDETLYREIVDRLDRDAVDGAVATLVLGAFTGELEHVLAESAAPEPRRPTAPGEAAASSGTFLRSVQVEGFRGIGPAAKLELGPGPGLTIVLGRNGSGKSSFAEAIEVLLTGDSRRWAGRSAVWKDGWRNLHHPACRITTEVIVEGRGPTRLTRAWGEAGAFEDAETVVERAGAKPEPIATIGWDQAVRGYRPLLSYNELGSMLDEGPSKLYDALSAILGLDALTQAQSALRDARLGAEKAGKEASKSLAPILDELAGLGDDRARRCHAALAGKQWDLEVVDEVLSRGTDDHADLARLRELATLTAPDPERAAAAASSLREAIVGAEAAAGTDAGRDLATADLLDRALQLHASHGDRDCPVCGEGSLDASWRERARQESERLRASASAASEARRALDDARREAAALCVAAPVVLDGDAGRMWASFAAVPDDPAELSAHLESQAPALAAAVAGVREAAAAELARREDAWRPVTRRVADWMTAARPAAAAGARVKDLKSAEGWVKDVTAETRDARFEPIGAEAQEIWKLLRQQSNVELGAIKLAGSGPARKVTLDVTVDGMDGSALGVMSQGELNSLALSLFLPRATLPESPFRFVVIDDPVQSMDPAKVDGLARVLERAARGRQVLVFTHDGRLADAVRRLQIDASIVEVARRESSVVELREALTPVRRALLDAYSLAATDGLPPKVAARVIPGFLRHAIEAQCTDVVRRRRLSKGAGLESVEEEIAGMRRLTEHAALALFDDASRTSDVMPYLDKKVGSDAADAFKLCNKGAHEPIEGDLMRLVRSVEGLVRELAKL